MIEYKAALRPGSIGLIVVLLIGILLLFYNLGGLSLSADEFFNVAIERGSLGHVLHSLQSGHDLHPPLTHLIMNLWLRFVGENEWTVRLPWSVVGLLNLWLVYRLGVALSGDHLGIVAAFLTITAPTFVLYTRFEKYYSLTIALSLALTLAGLNLWRHPGRRTALLYGCLLALLLYTDYLAPFFLVLAWDLLLMLFGKDWKRLRLFLVAQTVAGIAFLPWLSVLLVQAQSLLGAGEADLASTWIGVTIKLAYLFLSFSVGETLFPWRPVAVMGLIAALMMLSSLLALRHRKIIGTGVPLLAFLAIHVCLSAVGSAILTSYLFPSVPFIAFANHILFILPFFSLLLGSAILAVPHRTWVIVLMGVFVLARTISLHNYFTAQEYHNPIYAVPTRQVVSQIIAECRPGDVIFSAPDIAFQYYYDRGPKPVPSLPSTEVDPALTYLREERPSRVWLLTFGRDRTHASTPSELISWLEENYSLTLEQGYVEQDPVYRQVKERLLHRPAYRYKLLVRRYEKRQT